MYRLEKISSEAHQPVMRSVRARIEHGGERLWRMEDFSDLPSMPAAQALSRLTKAGLIQRLSKGTYYKPGQSSFGKTRPNTAAIRNLANRSRALFPSGTAAANLLGFTTQAAARGELSTSSASVPRKLIGADAIVHTRRPEAWRNLNETEAAILDFMRQGGRTSELTPDETINRMSGLLSKPKTFARLLEAAPSEPPRVRAILGAFGEKIGTDRKKLASLHQSLNPLSKFDFGIFATLPNAKAWQAKGRR